MEHRGQTKNFMKIVAHMGVKDEVELVESCLRHLRMIGVDKIIACDMGSTDGTLALLRKDCAPDLEVLSLEDIDADGIEALKEKNVAAIRRSGADWAMFLDADEYWLPATGRIHDCASLEGNDLLTVGRYNIVREGSSPNPPPMDARNYDRLLLYARQVEGFRQKFEVGTAPPWIQYVPVSKVMVRPSCIGAIGTGGHAVAASGDQPLQRAQPGDLLIAHLPFTTKERFARKINNVRRIFGVHDQYFGVNMAWHWRKWLELDTEAKVTAEFSRQIIAPRELTNLRAQGAIRSAAEMLDR